MSVLVMALVYKSRLGCVYRKAVALKLGDCANDEGENVWPSVATIAAQAEVSERTVRNKLSELVGLGLVEVVRPGGGYGVTTRYRFNLDRLSAVAYGRSRVQETNDGPELVGAENPAPGAPISDPNYPAPGAGFRKTTLQLTSTYPAPGAYEPSLNHQEEVKKDLNQPARDCLDPVRAGECRPDDLSDLNDATATVVAGVARIFNRLSPDCVAARRWVASNGSMYGFPAVRDGYADLMAAHATAGRVVQVSIKTLAGYVRTASESGERRAQARSAGNPRDQKLANAREALRQMIAENSVEASS